VSSVQHSVKRLVAESLTLPSAALGNRGGSRRGAAGAAAPVAPHNTY
jgi:hypothetical protein